MSVVPDPVPYPRDGALSAHFMLSEFAGNDGTLPPLGSTLALRRLCDEVLEPMRAQFGVCTVTSGWRSDARNRLVGGAPNSRHLYHQHPQSPAADVRFARGTPEQWAALAIRLRVGGVGLYRSHVHVDQRRTLARW